MSQSVIEKIRGLNEGVPVPIPLPSSSDLKTYEESSKFTFHQDFRDFLLKVSDVCYSTFEPVQITQKEAHNFLENVWQDAQEYGVPSEYVPVCMDNADFYCMNKSGEILFWSHDMKDFTQEKWSSIWDWIEQVWIGEAE